MEESVTDTTNQYGSLCDPEYVMKVIEGMGGPRAIHEDLLEFRRLVDRLWEQQDELMEKYPDKWVALSMDGVVSVGDSWRAVLDEVDRLGLRRGDVVINHLDTNPPILIL